MSVLVACDLDRTIVYSARAAAVSDADLASLVCVEVYEGAPLSYMTPASIDLLRELLGVAVVVPTTTRTPAQFARIAVPGIVPRHAITANGGILLVDGVVDADWRDHMADAVAAAGATLDEVARHLAAEGAAGWLQRLRDADGLFVYAIVDRDLLPPAVLDDFSRWCRERGWTVSLQGRKLYAVPEGISKSTAMRALAARLGADRVLAAGDSVLDAPMLEAADAAIRPAHGELHNLGWARPHVRVTTASGAAAGEEILAWLVATASGAAPGTGSSTGTAGPVPRGSARARPPGSH